MEKRFLLISMSVAMFDVQKAISTICSEKFDVSEWDQSMRRRRSYVALVEDQIAGFSDVSESGYIDMMYVSPGFARKRVADELIAFLEKQARSYSVQQLTADVSTTARPLF